ncbi:hypothetical protein [Thalassobius sp. Cn5-15]|uniref:hypothetical protein n=1 Tax=Thalassobius sp. Cn5-15 TaxID=2917763 RepID=UPI001EF1F346|nr:hypothetical protein [Thalassobius sp. Cn5-15]MCG7493856.1 hypothetical protein [Thalassobius sp. Cn5-15]
MMILFLAGCDMAGRNFRGVPPTRVAVADMQFTMRAAGHTVEAIRTNPMADPRMDQVSLLAGMAMETLTSCEVRQIGGDVAVVQVKLHCNDPADAAVLAAGGDYKCRVSKAGDMWCRSLAATGDA